MQTEEEASRSEYELEQEFAEHTRQVEVSEEIPGVYGHGVVRDVRLGAEVDEYVLEAPDGSEVVLPLDSQPSTTQSRHYAFLDLIGVEWERQLDAIGEQVPFAYSQDEDRWVPVFPPSNSSVSHAQFSLAPLFMRLRLLEIDLYADDEDSFREGRPHFTLSDGLLWVIIAGVLGLSLHQLMPSWGALGSLIIGVIAALLVVIILAFTEPRCGTLPEYDSDGVERQDD